MFGPGSCESEIASFLSKRIDDKPLVISAASEPAVLNARINGYANQRGIADCLTVDAIVRSAATSEETIGYQLTPERCLVIGQLVHEEVDRMLVLSVHNGPAALACCAVRNAIESWNLSLEATASRSALEESAMQLAQCFEEQNWLRGFARNASSFSRRTTANDMAVGILQPLGYLLRAQDIFLIVDPEETERSGLADAKYGSSGFSIDTIREMLKAMDIIPTSPPNVQNNISLQTRDGMVLSLIVVSIVGAEHTVGHLVGINRSTDRHSEGLPIYDPEFGSGDVGLLEEAAVLLATQAHNIHLLVRSNQLFLGTLHAMSSAIDARDKYTQGHSERVARLSFDLAHILGLSDEACQEIYLAGILHDIGKIGIPDSVLLKPGPLDEEEFKIIQQHPEIGYHIVESLGHLQFVLPGVLYHHERWDGRGYPHGLKGENTPLMARIMAVADAFDAMTSSRPYRNAMPVEKARQIISAGSGQQWDAQVVECFQIWLARRTEVDQAPIVLNQSIIPQDSPMTYMVQAVMALGH